MNQFSELHLSSVLKKNLERNGFAKPTPVQAGSIPPALEGRDVVATAQTGTGKTLAFVLPMIERLLAPRAEVTPHTPAARALIFSPTRELAIQIHETFVKLATGTNLRAAIVVGGMNETNQLRQIRAGAQVLIATPGRLEDFLNRKLVKLSGIEVFVLDEADRMLDMGFIPTIKRIAKMLPTVRQTMLFSATIEPSVAHLIAEQVKNPIRVEIGSHSKPIDLVDLHVYQVEKDRKLAMLSHLLEADAGSFLVFTKTKHGADRLSRKLSVTGYKATRIHGDRTQNQRNQALAGFKNGDYRILVATDVAARGIHVDGISHVVNFDLPMVPEDFIHRIGRTGRAGSRGTASTFYMREERQEIRRIERTVKVPLTLCEAPANLEIETKTASHQDAPARGHKSQGSAQRPGQRSAQRSGQESAGQEQVPFWKKAKQLAQAGVERGSQRKNKRFGGESTADALSDMWTQDRTSSDKPKHGAYRSRQTPSGHKAPAGKGGKSSSGPRNAGGNSRFVARKKAAAR